MAIDKPLLSRTSGQTTSGIADRVVGLSNNTLTLSPTDNQTADNASGKSQPPQGFDGPVPDALTGKIPERATAGSVTSSNDDRQAAVNDKLGLVDQASAIDALLGRGGDQSNGNDDRRSDLLSSFGPGQTDGMPGVDQGFGPSPDGAALAASAAVSGNPMKAFEAASVAGPLGELAVSQVKTPQDFDDDLIAKKENSNSFLDWIKQKLSGGPQREGHEHLNPPQPSPDPDPAPAPSPPEPAPDPDPAPDPAMPAPENQGVKVRVLSEAILDQLQAAQAGKPTSQGGSGDATPVDDGGIGGVVRVGDIAPNQSSIDGRNLFGQPVGPGVENNSGGSNKGLNGFGNSNGAGGINPGPEGGTPQGDGRFAEDPGQAIGGRQTSPNLNGGMDATRQDGSNSGQAEDLLLTGTNRADTLRGLSGNDTLRGLAGNDILDGGAGRDLLTGGAGADRFRFSAGSGFGQTQADRITDFNRAHGDRIEISRQAFGIAAGTAVTIQSVSTDRALDRALAGGSLLVQDQRDGALLFNQNGAAAGFGSGGVFAILTNGASLQASDFALIA